MLPAIMARWMLLFTERDEDVIALFRAAPRRYFRPSPSSPAMILDRGPTNYGRVSASLHVLPMAEKPALVIESVVIGLSVLGLSAVIDCWWYGHWVLPQLNFMGFNMLAQGAQRYGKHPVKLMHTIYARSPHSTACSQC